MGLPRFQGRPGAADLVSEPQTHRRDKPGSRAGSRLVSGRRPGVDSTDRDDQGRRTNLALPILGATQRETEKVTTMAAMLITGANVWDGISEQPVPQQVLVVD